MVNLDQIFGTYQKVLAVREEKLSFISSNIANQDTPGFKARDVDFKAAVRSAESANYAHLSLNQPAHGGMPGFGDQDKYPVKYRVPSTDSLDGNTVDGDLEKVAFMQNVVGYNSTLAFIQSRKVALMSVIKGE